MMSTAANKKKKIEPKDESNASNYALLQMEMSEIEKTKTNSMPKKKDERSSKDSKMKEKGKDKGRKEDSPSPSKNFRDSKKSTNPNAPDRSYGDYYCILCDSHMNSDGMWDAHVTGKRHIKNLKKGDGDSKYEDLEGVESNIKYELRNVKDPIVGLSYIHEIRRREPNVPALYNCFLCHASIATVPLVIEHVISLKHRLNYMKENSPEEFELLGATNLKKGHMEPLVHEAIIKMEQKFGRGTVKVKQEKPKPQVVTYKRNFDDYDDRSQDQWKSTKSEKSSSTWKSVDEKKYSTTNRNRSPEDYRDMRMTSYPADEDGYKRSARMKRDMPLEQDYYGRSRSRSRSTDRDHYSRKYEHDHYSRSDHSRDRSPYRLSSDYDTLYSRHDIKKESFSTKNMSDDIYSRHDLKKESFSTKNLSDDIYSRHDIKKDSFSTKNMSDENYQKDRSCRSREDNLLPHEKSVQKPDPVSEILTDLVQKMLALPTGVFLTIANCKMENLELQGLEDLDKLSNLISKAQLVLCSKLPPQVQAVLKQKMSQSSENDYQKIIPGFNGPAVMPSSTKSYPVKSFEPSISLDRPNTENVYKQDVQSNISFIRDILNGAKSASTAVHNPSAPQNLNYQNPNSNQNQYSSYKDIQYPASNVQYQSSNTTAPVPNLSFPPPSTSSNIPGLTLTDQTSPQSQTYDNYNRYSTLPPYNQNYPYKY